MKGDRMRESIKNQLGLQLAKLRLSLLMMKRVTAS